MLKKSTLTAAVALSLGTGAAQAAKFNMTFMDFPGAQNITVVGTIDTSAGTGTYNSGETPFFGHDWTGTVVAGFESSGAGSWQYTAASGASATGTYNFTLAPGQVAMGVLFDWNGNVGIPVLNIMNADGSGVDIDGDGTLGTKMAAGPFVTSPVGFSGAPIAPCVTANDITLNALTGQPKSWIPSLSNATTNTTCSIGQGPTAPNTASVQNDCSAGTFTGTTAGNDSFTYTVTESCGSDTATVTVNISANPPPTTMPDSAQTTAGSATTIDVLGNDTDDVAINPGSVVVTAQPVHGTATVAANNGAITYQPDAGFCGTDTLNYTVDDDTGQTSSPETVTIDVNSSTLCSSDAVTLTAGSSDPDNDGHVTLSELISAGIPADSGVTTQCIGGCFDYQLTGLTGPTATLILPLSQTIPGLAKLRKWDGNAWTDFVVGGSDSVSTAASVNGTCPAGGYSQGLINGNDCIQLVISDGGPNDQDGVVNGTIIDPVGVGSQTQSSATTDLADAFGSIGGSGCVIAKTQHNSLLHRFDWAVLLGFVTWLGFGRKNRKPQ